MEEKTMILAKKLIIKGASLYVVNKSTGLNFNQIKRLKRELDLNK